MKRLIFLVILFVSISSFLIYKRTNQPQNNIIETKRNNYNAQESNNNFLEVDDNFLKEVYNECVEKIEKTYTMVIISFITLFVLLFFPGMIQKFLNKHCVHCVELVFFIRHIFFALFCIFIIIGFFSYVFSQSFFKEELKNKFPNLNDDILESIINKSKENTNIFKKGVFYCSLILGIGGIFLLLWLYKQNSYGTPILKKYIYIEKND